MSPSDKLMSVAIRYPSAPRKTFRTEVESILFFLLTLVIFLHKKEKESSNFNTIKIYENMCVCVWFQNKRKGEKNSSFSFQSYAWFQKASWVRTLNYEFTFLWFTSILSFNFYRFRFKLMFHLHVFCSSNQNKRGFYENNSRENLKFSSFGIKKERRRIIIFEIFL